MWEILVAIFAIGVPTGLGLAQLLQLIFPYFGLRREKKHINSCGFFVEKEVITDQKGGIFLPDKKVNFKQTASWEEKMMRVSKENFGIAKMLVTAGLRIREKKDATSLFLLSIINRNIYPIRDVGASVYFHPLFFKVGSPVESKHCAYEVTEDGYLFNVKCGELNFMENALIVIPVSTNEDMLKDPKDFDYFSGCTLFLKYGKSRAYIDRGIISTKDEIPTKGAPAHPIFSVNFASFPGPRDIKQE